VIGGLAGSLSVPPAEAHWADLAVAEIVVAERQTQMTLTLPTGLVIGAALNGQLSPEEINAHHAELEALLARRIYLTDGGRSGSLTVKPAVVLPANLSVTPGTHSTLLLTYTWPQPVERLTIHYDLFLPGVPTASCLATIVTAGKVRTFVFTPSNRDVSLVWKASRAMGEIWKIPLALLTLVGAVLVGMRLTSRSGMPLEAKR
jgi:hypothetical protein